MKTIMRGIIFMILIGLLAACGNDATDNYDATQNNTSELDNTEESTDVDKDESDSTAPEENGADHENDANEIDDQTMIKEKMDDLGLAEIEIEVEYPDNTEYEVEIEKDAQGNYKVELEDEIENIKLKGIDAFEAIIPNLEKVEITKDSNHDDIINQIISAFELNGDFDEFEIEVVFSDGSMMEFEIEQ